MIVESQGVVWVNKKSFISYSSLGFQHSILSVGRFSTAKPCRSELDRPIPRALADVEVRSPVNSVWTVDSGFAEAEVISKGHLISRATRLPETWISKPQRRLKFLDSTIACITIQPVAKKIVMGFQLRLYAIGFADLTFYRTGNCLWWADLVDRSWLHIFDCWLKSWLLQDNWLEDGGKQWLWTFNI